MNGKELFSVAVRVIGLISIGRGFYDLLYVLMFALSLRIGDISVSAKAPDADLAFGLFYFFVGLYLLRGARFVVNFAYPHRNSETAEIEQKMTEGELNSN